MSTTLTESPVPEQSSWQQRIDTLKQRVIGVDRKMLAIGVTTVAITALIVAQLWMRSTPYQPLYGAQERYDNSEVLALLDQENMRYQIHAQTGQVMVPASHVAQTRIALAARGIQAKLPEGMEVLDRASGLGTSQFIESARYRQGVEGELARTILAMHSVQHARVHLAIPQRTLFVGMNEEKPTAAVMLDVTPGRQLAMPQVEAIVNLVAGAVTGMDIDGVSVIDQHGNLLSADLAMGQQGRVSSHYMEAQQRVERETVRRAADMLAPILGIGNFRVQVAASLNFDEVEETHEAIDSDPVVRTEFVKQDNSTGQLALGIPGSLSNQAPTEQQTNSNNESRNERAETSRQFDVGRKVRYTRQAQGSVSQLSVSVLLNESVQAWQQPQLEQIAQMIKDAVGFTETRGDQFSLHAFNFAQPVQTSSEPMPWWQEPQTLTLIEFGVYTLLGLAFILFVLRPLVKGLQRPSPTTELVPATAVATPSVAQVDPALMAEDANGSSAQASDEPAESGALDPIINLSKIDNEQDLADALLDAVTAGQVTPKEADELMAQIEPQQHNIDLSDLPPPGSELEVQVEHLQKLSDVESERVAEVIRKWVNSNES